MDANCAPLLEDLFLVCFVRIFNVVSCYINKADVVEELNSTLRYLDYVLSINNPYLEQMLSQIYPTALQLIKPYLNNEKPFLDLLLPS